MSISGINAGEVYAETSITGLNSLRVDDALHELAYRGTGLPYTSLIDPATNAITQEMIDNYGGVVITLTTIGNNQTLLTPSDLSIRHEFTVINKSTSTNTIEIIGSSSVVIDPGKKVSWIHDGIAWVASDLNIKQLDDNAGASSYKVINSDGITICEIFSDGTIKMGFSSVDSIQEINNSSGQAKITLNSVLGIINLLGVRRHTTTVNSATYTVLATDYDISVTYTPTGTVTITLPQALNIDGNEFRITDDGNNASNNKITIQDNQGTPVVLFTIEGNKDSITIYYNGTSWGKR